MTDIERPRLATQIQNLTPGLPEIGKIKIGVKGKTTSSGGGKSFQLPQRLDHFLVTTLQRGQDGNFIPDAGVHSVIGDKPTEIPISFLYNDPALNFQSRWACFVGTTAWCTGDGINAYRKTEQKPNESKVVPCPCERNQPDFVADKYKCKPSGVLSVVLENMKSVGGVYKFRTTSYNSVTNIMSSLALFYRVTGGVLSGIPFSLTVRPKTIIIPTSGKAMTVHIVGLEYQGSLSQLADIGYKMALENASHRERIDQIEIIAKSQIPQLDLATDTESEADIAEEFYPESVVADEQLPISEAEVEAGTFAEKLSQVKTMAADPIPNAAVSIQVNHLLQDKETPAAETPQEQVVYQNEASQFHEQFKDLVEAADTQSAIGKYITVCADEFDTTINKVMESACEHPLLFRGQFKKWIDQQQPQEPQEPTKPIDWNPMTAAIQKKYGAAKKAILMQKLDEFKMEYNPAWTGGRLHQILLVEATKNKPTVLDEVSVPDGSKAAAGPPDWYLKDGKKSMIVPAHESESFLEAEKKKVYHDLDQLAKMPIDLQRIYAEVSAKLGLMSEQMDPKEINAVLKTRYPDQWAAEQKKLGFGNIPVTDEAADRWNTSIIISMFDEG